MLSITMHRKGSASISSRARSSIPRFYRPNLDLPSRSEDFLVHKLIFAVSLRQFNRNEDAEERTAGA